VPGNPVGCTSKVTIPPPPNSRGTQFNAGREIVDGHVASDRCVQPERLTNTPSDSFAARGTSPAQSSLVGLQPIDVQLA
jgi:hypothetical protein